MKIKTDENGYVTGFVTLGDMDGAVEFNGTVPDNFAEDCLYYKLVAGVLVFDTDKKLAADNDENTAERINELIGLLANTDYRAIKYAEGQISAEVYAADKVQRQSWREEINTLESR